MEKEKYISTEMQVIQFEAEDIITISGLEDNELPIIPAP